MLSRRVLGLVALAASLGGCAHDRDWARRQAPVQSTLGNDPRKAPAGKAMVPPGLGVDLGLNDLVSPGNSPV